MTFPPIFGPSDELYIKSGNRIFEASPEGLRHYLYQIRASHPKLYLALMPDVNALQNEQTIGTISLISSLAVGIPLMTLAPLLNTSKKDATYSWVMLGGGASVMVAGLLTFLILKPGTGDLQRIIDKHNQLRPRDPLKLRIGLNPDQKGVYAILHIRVEG